MTADNDRLSTLTQLGAAADMPDNPEAAVLEVSPMAKAALIMWSVSPVPSSPRCVR